MKNLLLLSIISIIITCNFLSTTAQNTSISLGQWREHTPFVKAIDVAIDNTGLVYCATQFGVFTYSKSNGELTALSRLKELSDLELSMIKYDPVTGVVVIAYQNSNIDLIFSNKNVVNLTDIKQKNIVGGKNINTIFCLNSMAYLGCEFGIVVVDINRKEIKDTYYIGPNGTNINVKGIAFDGTNLLAATENGIYKANYNDPNIFNYTAWVKDNSIAEPNANYTSATGLNGKFYVVKTNPNPDQDSVLVYENNQWVPFTSDATEGAYIDSYNNNLILRNAYKISAIDVAANELRNINILSYGNPSPDLRKGLLDAEGNFWVADFNNGLVCQRPDFSFQRIKPNSPRAQAAWAMEGSSGRLWVASGALLGDGPNYDVKDGVYRFAEDTWRTYDCSNDPIYGILCASGTKSVICLAIDPSDPDHVFVGAWGPGGGILEYRKDGGVNFYNTSNSALNAHSADPVSIIVGGLAFDDENNLWAVAGGNTNGISVRKTDGTWQSFEIPDVDVAGYGLYGLVVDDFGQKWFIPRGGSSSGKGLCVFKEGSLTSPNNNSFKLLTDGEGKGGLPHIFIRAIAKDKDGSVWLGTDKGVGVIYNPGNVFSGGNYDAQRIIIEQDGYNQYLLETEIVTSISIDGANRKWFGTYSGGVFLMSADGTEQILNFNTDNSPLPSNSITSIAIDDLTGEVFFGTDKGIISYRGDATEGGEACENYYVFPNPIRHEYRGPIAIRGLVANADVKIADVAGNVVYHTKANGGVAIWNGNNFSGVRAQTGVYIVYVTNEDGTQTCTTKMLFAN